MRHPLPSPRHTVFMVVVLAAAGATAQQLNPVYTDDSPVARETLARVNDFVSAGNGAEAVRELQKLLDDQGDRLVEAPGEQDLFVSVRARVHATLLATPALLSLYRAGETIRASQQLGAGEFEAVERSRLLTAPGFEAAMRMAQVQLESAQFDAAFRTLAQLEHHPERQGTGGAGAAELAGTIGRYLDRADVLTLAERWRREAGLADADAEHRRPYPAPDSLTVPQTDFFRSAPALNGEGIPPHPLWTTPIEPQPMQLEPEEAALRQEQEEQASLNLWIFPTVVGDTVFVNDGVFVAARDRFTLQPRWSVRPVSAEAAADPWAPRRAGLAARLIEDTCSVTVQGRTVVATMGLAQNGDRDGDAGTFALDATTGKVLWSALMPRLDPQLEGATVRGPAVIDGGTVILQARKTAQGRRIVSLYLVGLSLDDGSLRWVRPVGSAGAIPWGRGEQFVHAAALLHRGVVYCVDHLGVLAAVESATGRPVWVRRAPVPAAGGGRVSDLGLPWQWGLPLPDGDAVLTLSPDRAELLRIEQASGRVLARRAVSALGEPAYVLRVGERLALVGTDTVAFLPCADFEQGAATKTPRFPPPGIRGRVVVAGDRLLIPAAQALAIVDPAEPGADAATLPLDRLGNVLPLDSQLLAVDSTSLHSYLTWGVAQRLLQERMTASPDDPDPAITFADLAYRSGHADQIAPAADKALAAIDKAPTTDPMRRARQRLFGVLRAMVETSQDKWSPDPARPDQARPVRREQPGRRAVTRQPPPEMPVLDLKSMSLVMDRLGRAANSPDERVSHLMSLGRLRDAESRPALASEAYQSVLADPILAAASWQGPTTAVRAEIEATRRIRQLLIDRGPAAYAAFERQAQAELAALGAGATAPALEQLARRYPAAAAGVAAWARAADLHDGSGRSHATVGALREALMTAETVQSGGAAMDPALMGEVAGRLVRRLQALDQLFAAAQLLTRLRTQYPGVALLDHGAAIDAAAVARELAGRLAALERYPRIGTQIRGEVQALAGWSVMTPRSREQLGRACEHVLMVSATDRKVALWGLAGGSGGVGEAGGQTGGGGGGPGHLQQLWSREFKDDPPVLYRLDPDSAYLYWHKNAAGEGPVMERIGTVGGETRWRTEPIKALFPLDPDLERRIVGDRSFDAPLEGTVKLTDVVAAMDAQVLAMVERSGRAAAFDVDTGRLLWKASAPVQQVHDIDVGGGAIAIGGAAPSLDGAAGLRPVIAVYDARSGQVLHTMDTLAGRVRWLRLAEHAAGATLIAGLEPQIDAFDTVRAKLSWSIAGGAAFGSLDAWVFGDRLFVLDEHRSLWLAGLATGEMGRQPLETYEHLATSGRIDAFPIGSDRTMTAVTTDRGLCVFDNAGRLVGLDAVQGDEADEGALVPPAPGERYFVTIETAAHQTESGKTMYDLHVIEADTGILRSSRELALELPPRIATLLDGHIVVTAGNNTIVYSAPESDGK